jgi:subtilase family serine protease
MVRVLIALVACSALALAQRISGQLRLQVTDASGAALRATATLVGQATGVERSFQTDTLGQYTARALPFGRYRLQVDHPGFASYSTIIEIQSQSAVEYRVTLGVAPIETTVIVRDFDTLLDPSRTATTQHLTPQALRDRPSAAPGRGT